MKKEKLNEKNLSNSKKSEKMEQRKTFINSLQINSKYGYEPYAVPGQKAAESTECTGDTCCYTQPYETSNKKNVKKSNDSLKLEAEQFIAKQKKENDVIKVLTCRQGNEYVKLNDFYPGYGTPFNNTRLKTVFAHTTTVGVIRKSHDGSYILQIACARRNPKDVNNRRIGYLCALKRACDYSAIWQMNGTEMQTISVGPLYDLSMAAKIFNRIAVTFNSDFSYEADIEVQTKSKKKKSVNPTTETNK